MLQNSQNLQICNLFIFLFKNLNPLNISLILKIPQNLNINPNDIKLTLKKSFYKFAFYHHFLIDNNTPPQLRSMMRVCKELHQIYKQCKQDIEILDQFKTKKINDCLGHCSLY